MFNFLVGITPFVDNFTHFGGMILGFLCGLSTIQLVSPRFFGDEHHYFYCVKLLFFRSFGLIVSMTGIIASSIVLFAGDGKTNPCSTCTYMSCIAFPPWTDKNDKWWYCDDCIQATAEVCLFIISRVLPHVIFCLRQKLIYTLSTNFMLGDF